MELLFRLQQDLRSDDRRGTVYFAHLLAPHNPYEVDAACRSQTRPSLWLEIENSNTPDARALRYELYSAQERCLYRHLESLLHTIDSLPGGRQITVIVHGDHGSRIALHYPSTGAAPLLRPSDYTDGFSTLFAIRTPGIPAGYDRRFMPIGELVGRALESGFSEIQAPESEPHVLKLSGSACFSPSITVRLSDTALALPDRTARPAETISSKAAAAAGAHAKRP
jgi:hypothetical protein